MGKVVAWDLIKDRDIEAMGLVDRHKDALENTKSWIASEKIKAYALDIYDRDSIKSLMKEYDVGVIALPTWKASYKVVEMAIKTGLDTVNMLEEYHRRPDPIEGRELEIPGGMTLDEYGDSLHNRAVDVGITLVDGMGFAPGLTNVTLGDGISKMETVEKATARAGGIPTKEASKNHPLRYTVTWAFWHVLREYTLSVKIRKNGKVVDAEPISDLEKFRFNEFGKDEELECVITPGMPSFIYTRPQLLDFAEKTIRWPGHWQGIQTLKECGMLDQTPVEFKGMKIAPREFLSSLITPKLQPLKDETDICVMYNTLIGKKDKKKMKIEYFMWEKADTENGISSMARTTGFPVAVTAKLLLQKKIKEKGIIPPEDCIKGNLYEEFMQELKKRNVLIREVSTLM
jgi:saccharopine dehydrogenase-like NADP-dependent oxidoreductase